MSLTKTTVHRTVLLSMMMFTFLGNYAQDRADVASNEMTKTFGDFSVERHLLTMHVSYISTFIASHQHTQPQEHVHYHKDL